MEGNAAHGDVLTLLLVPGSESNAELASGYDGIFIEQLVEVAQTKQE
jgi:hypothetical protein